MTGPADEAVRRLRGGWPKIGNGEAGGNGVDGTSWPSVSLVTPSLNQAGYLEDAILSVLKQNYPSLEYAVIDGGSDDGTLDIIERYSDRLAYWTSEPDRGQANAINKGWLRSTGKYFWWLNADDMLAPGSVKRAVAFLEANPEVDLLYGNLHRIDERGSWLGLYEYCTFTLEDFLLYDLDISQAGGLARRVTVERVGDLNETYQYLMDKEFWLRLALEGGRLAHLPEPQAFFRIHQASKTQRGSHELAQERTRLTEWALAYPGCPEEVRRRRDLVWANVRLHTARDLVKAGGYSLAWGELAAAARSSGSVLLKGQFWTGVLLAGVGLILRRRSLEVIRAFVRRLRRSAASILGRRAGI